jgi:DNA-binding NarL/FixJ family response regulator
MARVLALVPDLLFGSRLAGALHRARLELELLPDATALRARLADTGAPPAQVLIVDLADEQLGGVELIRSLHETRALRGIAALGFYAHVDTATRKRAEEAGFDLVVPRSRMAREAAQLVARLT